MQRTLTVLSIVLLTFIGFTGCDSGSTAKPANQTTTDAHPEEGPHEGALLELGDEEYHAEMVHDNNGVTVYILDSSAKKAVPIAAKSVTIVVRDNGESNNYELQAKPLDGETDMASRFVSTDKVLHAAIDKESAKSQLQVTIKESPYTVEIVEHDHDHD